MLTFGYCAYFKPHLPLHIDVIEIGDLMPNVREHMSPFQTFKSNQQNLTNNGNYIIGPVGAIHRDLELSLGGTNSECSKECFNSDS